MTIRPFNGNPCLCPLDTLMTYIERTKAMRQKVDRLFVLVTTSVPRPATRTTIVHWAKNIMRAAGLETHTIHSIRGATSSAALLLGLPFDQIVSCVGWNKASTFIKHYTKPVTKSKSKMDFSPVHDHPKISTDKEHTPPENSHRNSLKAMLDNLPRKIKQPKDIPVFPTNFEHCSIADRNGYTIINSQKKTPSSCTISKPPVVCPDQSVTISQSIVANTLNESSGDSLPVSNEVPSFNTPPWSGSVIKLLSVKTVSKPKVKIVKCHRHTGSLTPLGTNLDPTNCSPSNQILPTVAPRNHPGQFHLQLGNGPTVSKLNQQFSSVIVSPPAPVSSLPVHIPLSITIPPFEEWPGIDVSQHSCSLLGIGEDLPLTIDLDKDQNSKSAQAGSSIELGHSFNPDGTPDFALDHSDIADFSDTLEGVTAKMGDVPFTQ